MPGPLFPIQNFVAVPYAGFIQGLVVSILSKSGITTNDGQTITAGRVSKVVNITLDFLSTQYEGQAVSINLQSSANVAPLDQLIMIYVDNELNSQDVTVYFPATQQYIGVPAFTTGYYPVLTGQQQAIIYNGASGKVPVTAQSQASVIFCNFFVPGFLSLESQSITFNSSNGPVIRSIADKVVTGQLSGSANLATLLPLIAPPAQYVVTGISVNATNLFTDGYTTYPGPPPTPPVYVLGIALVDTGAEDAVRIYDVAMNSQFENSRFFSISNETELNIPLQGLDAEAVQESGIGLATLPPQSFIAITITYATVTL